MTKLKLIAAALASLVGLTIGAGLLAQQSRIGDAGQRAEASGGPAAKESEAGEFFVRSHIDNDRTFIGRRVQDGFDIDLGVIFP